MAGKKGEDIVVRCSFCGKTQAQVRKLIAGPNSTFICDECVEVCAEIIDEEFEVEEVNLSEIIKKDEMAKELNNNITVEDVPMQ